MVVSVDLSPIEAAGAWSLPATAAWALREACNFVCDMTESDEGFASSFCGSDGITGVCSAVV